MSKFKICRILLPRFFSRNLTQPQRTISVANEPVLLFEPGSEDRKNLLSAIEDVKKDVVNIPVVVNGKEHTLENFTYQVCPYEHERKIAKISLADKSLIESAIDGALEAREKWDQTPSKERVSVFLKAADLLAGPWRPKILAACMVGQGKTAVQAEIDAACELIDFWRYNSKFALDIEATQPINAPDANNHVVYRGLEGFVAAITPFNFTAISTNLPTAPTKMGCVSLWKPANSAVLASWYAYQALRECGLPDGIIQWVPSEPEVFGDVAINSEHLAALNFTGSTKTFKYLWQKVAQNIDTYQTFPRIVGETGGKNYHFVHQSADLDSVVGATVRGAFEYQGQKCSACSRMFIPKSKADYIKRRLVEETSKVVVGPADDLKTFVSAVIDEKAFDRVSEYIDHGNKNANVECLIGGSYDKSTGYYVQPTIFETSDLDDKLIREEIFGPVLTIYTYDDAQAEELLETVDKSTSFGLTGSIFSQDASFTELAMQKLRHSCGNMYINDKSTGSVVHQQPFGGARMSGTNDKAGTAGYMMRWTSPLAIKTAVGDRKTWRYPSMD